MVGNQAYSTVRVVTYVWKESIGILSGEIIMNEAGIDKVPSSFWEGYFGILKYDVSPDVEP